MPDLPEFKSFPVSGIAGYDATNSQTTADIACLGLGPDFKRGNYRSPFEHLLIPPPDDLLPARETWRG